MKNKYSLLFFMIWGMAVNTFAQNVYRTLSGDIAISITNHDSTLLMVSNDLLVMLDYETSKVNFRVAYETFHTGIDSFDKRLKMLTDSALEFNGKIGITINTNNFTQQKYNLEGTLTNAVPPATVRGNGSMTCIPSGDRMTPACTLLLSFETSLAALNLTQVFTSSKPGARIDLRQSILEKADQ